MTSIIINPYIKKPYLDIEEDVIFLPYFDNTTIQHEKAHAIFNRKLGRFGNIFEELFCCIYAVISGRGFTKGFILNLFGMTAYSFIIISISYLIFLAGRLSWLIIQ